MLSSVQATALDQTLIIQFLQDSIIRAKKVNQVWSCSWPCAGQILMMTSKVMLLPEIESGLK